MKLCETYIFIEVVVCDYLADKVTVITSFRLLQHYFQNIQFAYCIIFSMTKMSYLNKIILILWLPISLTIVVSVVINLFIDNVVIKKHKQ